MADSFGARVNTLLAALTVGTLVLAPSNTASQTAAKASSRTAWGHPDLQGIWTTDAEILVPFERPAQFGDRPLLTDEELAKRAADAQRRIVDDKSDRRAGSALGTPEHWFEIGNGLSARTSFIVDPANGRLPPLIPGAKRIEGLYETGLMTNDVPELINNPEDTGLASRCITRGVPETWMPSIYNNGFQIVQTPDYLVIHHERYSELRIIALDGSAHVSPRIRRWTGDARGRWEGETLVVDVTNFTNKARFKGSGETLHIVERLTRVGADTLNVAVTVEDPTRWARPWRFEVNGRKDPKYRIFEMACHEGNYTQRHIMSAARVLDRTTEGAATPVR
jgi:hypothetical protein